MYVRYSVTIQNKAEKITKTYVYEGLKSSNIIVVVGDLSTINAKLNSVLISPSCASYEPIIILVILISLQ